MNTRLLRLFRKLGVSLVSPRVFYAGAMVALGTIIVGILIWWLVSLEKTQHLVIYSGQARGTYYPLAQEIAKVIERDNPQIRCLVKESEGSVANLKQVALQNDGEAHILSIVQNDVAIPAEWDSERAGSIRSLLPLHSGVLHFMVPADSDIRSISDLRGKTVAEGLKESGTPALVNALMAHYEISTDEVDLRYLSLQEACDALRDGSVDAMVLSMGLKSPEIEELIDEIPVRVVGIGRSTDPGSEIDGFRLIYPFVQAGYIPKYAYSAPREDRDGVPAQAVPTISLRAVLIAHRDLPDFLALRVARTLIENRSSLSRSHSSASQITERFDPALLQFPIHQGAHRYFHRDDPSFLRRNAELLGFMLSLLLAAWGFLLSAQRWVVERRKDRIDAYYIELDKILDPLYRPDASFEDLQEVDNQLLAIQRRAIRLLASDRLMANESFRIFQGLLSEGRQEIEKRTREIRDVSGNESIA